MDNHGDRGKGKTLAKFQHRANNYKTSPAHSCAFFSQVLQKGHCSCCNVYTIPLGCPSRRPAYSHRADLVVDRTRSSGRKNKARYPECRRPQQKEDFLLLPQPTLQPPSQRALVRASRRLVACARNCIHKCAPLGPNELFEILTLHIRVLNAVC